MKPAKLGRYEIVREIGRGAMGVVYAARDPVLDRTVAIKTVSMSLDPTERADYQARFLQEAKAAGGMAHPNIVTVYDVGMAADVVFMAMEYLQGPELGDLMRSNGGLTLEKAIDIAAQISEGLAYAHERGVVHRDIKPPNIMVLDGGLVKITDFGIARRRSSNVKTQTGLLLGSPRYMSPEVFLGKKADARSDIFSLGIILYELLTGVAPFTGESVSSLMYQTINFMPPPPGSLRPSVPAMLDFIVAKTLAKNPDERYADARALAADLRDCSRRLAGDSAAAGISLPPGSKLPPVAPVDADDDALGVTMPMAAEDSEALAAVGPRAPTLGISREFDSLQATHRLAMRFGVENDKAQPPPDRQGANDVAENGTETRPMSSYRVVSGLGPAREPWTRRELAIFSTGVSIAFIAAAVIALG